MVILAEVVMMHWYWLLLICVGCACFGAFVMCILKAGKDYDPIND